MQLKVYQLLNTILLTTIFLLVIIFGFIFFRTEIGQNETGRIVLIILLFIINFIIINVYRYIETNWDRKIILRMLENEEIVLAEIINSDVVKVIRDTRGKTYLIHRIQAKAYLSDMSVIDISFYEKMNKNVTKISKGFVYITYHPEKEGYHFIVQNDLLTYFPELEPIVRNYEKRIKGLKYLYAYQQDGLHLATMQEMLKNQ